MAGQSTLKLVSLSGLFGFWAEPPIGSGDVDSNGLRFRGKRSIDVYRKPSIYQPHIDNYRGFLQFWDDWFDRSTLTNQPTSSKCDLLWFDWFKPVCLGGTPWWNPVKIYQSYGWNSRIENFKTICEIPGPPPQAPKTQKMAPKIAWTFRIRWDDSQAIIRTWQILSQETACCRFPRFCDGWMLFGFVWKCWVNIPNDL